MSDTAGFLSRVLRPGAAETSLADDAHPFWGKHLRMRVEPSLAELVGTTVALLRAKEFPSVAVTDPRGRKWPSAYVLGSLTPARTEGSSVSGFAVAEVVLDGAGRLVRNHQVQVSHSPHRPLPVSCPSLAERYEQFIQATRLSEVPPDEAMVMTRHGELLISDSASRIVTVAEYLNALCRDAVGRTPGL